MPPHVPADASPVTGQGPDEGSLYGPDAQVLAEVARKWTTTPDDCWFCVWDGYGWANAVPLLLMGEEQASRMADPVPPEVRQGPRVHFPHRSYLLYGGQVEEVMATFAIATQSPNLWWPQDHAWCVATEIDFAWTYVGGPAAMIEELLGDIRIEAIRASPEDSPTGIASWVESLIDEATDQLMERGVAVLSTSAGTVEAALTKPTRLRRGGLSVTSQSTTGISGSGHTPLSHQSAEALRQTLAFHLTTHVIGLVGG